MLDIINPHNKISRLVKESDLERVYKDAEEIYLLLNQKIGMADGAFAIAHPQCVEEDPLRFFVVKS